MDEASLNTLKMQFRERRAELLQTVEAVGARMTVVQPLATWGSAAAGLELEAVTHEREVLTDAAAAADIFLGLPEASQMIVGADVRRRYVDRALSMTREGRAALAARHVKD